MTGANATECNHTMIYTRARANNFRLHLFCEVAVAVVQFVNDRGLLLQRAQADPSLTKMMRGMKGMLPPEMHEQFKAFEVPELPAAIDPTSRQLMFQQINMMTQQYQQIMQALSEIMNKMNEMAMDPIRKMGR